LTRIKKTLKTGILKKKSCLFIIYNIIFLININQIKLFGQITLLSENFNNSASIPAGWSQIQVTGTDVWTINNGGYYDNGSNHPSSAYSGTRNAFLFSPTSPPSTNTRKLVTPVLDLSGLSNITLKFYEARLKWGVDFDELKVYYKTSSTGSWNLLANYNSAITAWTQRTINLSNPSSTYYIAFEGIAKYGYGICLDDIVITATIANDISLTDIWVENKKTIKATLKNLGPNTITSVALNISINGGTTITSNWTGSLTTGNSTEVSFGNYNFPHGTTNLKAWTSNANNNGDGNKSNDTISTIYTLIKNFPYQQGFENLDLGNWKQVVNDDMDWTRLSGATPSSLTGPDAALEGSYYIYTEASGFTPSKKAEILTADFDISKITNPFIELWYHMYGTQIGELHIDIDSAATWKNDIMTPLSGNKGNTWYKKLIDLNSYRYLNKIRIRAFTGNGFLSDLAIDDFKIVDIPDPNLGMDKNVCEGDTLDLEVDTGYGYKFIWKKVGYNDTLSITNKLRVTKTASYYITISAPYGYVGADTINITFNPNPVANFSVNQQDQCLKNNYFVFTNNSSIASGSLGFDWDFGDNTDTNLINSFHTYNTADSFNVRLIAISAYNCKDTFLKTVYINPQPVPSFTINANSQCLLGNQYNFTNTSTISNGSMNFKWYFGDNDSSSFVNSSHIYLYDDTFNITLIATSIKGCNDTFQDKVFVRPMPASDFTINDSDQCLSGNQFDFVNKSYIKSGTFTSKWDFGDNSFSSVINPNKTYSLPANYSVKLITNSNFGCNDTVNKTVYVFAMPKAKIYLVDSAQCLKDNKFMFADTSTIIIGKIAARMWSFGDGSSSFVANPAYSYSKTGNFTVKLLVSSDNNCSDSSTRQVIVHPMADLNFSAPNYNQCFKNNLFEFTNTSSISSGILYYSWNFGDGGFANTKNAQHSYLQEGKYNVWLAGISDKGCIDSIKKSVEVFYMPEASFSINQRSQCLTGNNYIFTNTSFIVNGTFNSKWFFGDSDSSTQYSTAHSYNKADTFNVRLIVLSDKGCLDTLNKNVFIRPMPKAQFTINDSSQCLENNNFIFTQNSFINYGTLTYHWNFNNQDTSNAENPSYSFSKPDTFSVKLTVNSNFNCKDSIIKKVIIFKPPYVFIGNDTTINDTSQLLLNAGNGFISYLWQDNSISQYFLIDTTTAIGEHKYFVVVTDSNFCNNSDTITIKIVSLGSAKFPFKNNIEIFPNPANENINIHFSEIFNETTLLLKTMDGKIISQENIQPNENKHVIILNINELAKGIYFLQVSDNLYTTVYKIIKN